MQDNFRLMGAGREAAVHTGRLVLRQFTPDDLDAYAAIIGAHDVGKWLPKGAGFTREETERFMNYMAQHWDKHGYGIWAVTDARAGELFGHCGLNLIEKISEVEVPYALGPAYWGRGYATEAARASLWFGFEAVGLSRIIALSKPENVASRNVIEKLGLRYEKDTYLFGLDLVCYGISREGWLQRECASIT